MFGWGEGVILKSAGSNGHRNSVPARLSMPPISAYGLSKPAHKASASVSSWGLMDSVGSPDSSPAFGWSDLTPQTETSVITSSTMTADTLNSRGSRGTPAPWNSLPIHSLKDPAPPAYPLNINAQKPLPSLVGQPPSPVSPQSHHKPEESTSSISPTTAQHFSSTSSTVLPTSGDNWTSLDMFESSNSHPLSTKKATVNHPVLPEVPPISAMKTARHSGVVGITPTNMIKEEGKVGIDDEWGDFIDAPVSPSTPMSPRAYPTDAGSLATIHLSTSSSSANNNPSNPTRKPSIISAVSHIKSSLLSSKLLHRNSAPSLDKLSSPSASTVIGSKLHFNNASPTETLSRSSSAQDATPTKTVEWDFSVFEQTTPKVLDPPRSQSVAAPEGHLKAITPGTSSKQEDDIVNTIIDGLPDLSYMLHQ